MSRDALDNFAKDRKAFYLILVQGIICAAVAVPASLWISQGQPYALKVLIWLACFLLLFVSQAIQNAMWQKLGE